MSIKIDAGSFKQSVKFKCKAMITSYHCKNGKYNS